MSLFLLQLTAFSLILLVVKLFWAFEKISLLSYWTYSTLLLFIGMYIIFNNQFKINVDYT